MSRGRRDSLSSAWIGKYGRGSSGSHFALARPRFDAELARARHELLGLVGDHVGVREQPRALRQVRDHVDRPQQRLALVAHLVEHLVLRGVVQQDGEVAAREHDQHDAERHRPGASRDDWLHR